MRPARQLLLSSSLLLVLTGFVAHPVVLHATSCTTNDDCDCDQACIFGECGTNAECVNNDYCEEYIGPGSTCDTSTCHEWTCGDCSCPQDYGFDSCSEGWNNGLYYGGDGGDFCSVTYSDHYYLDPYSGTCSDTCTRGPSTCPAPSGISCYYAADPLEWCSPTEPRPCFDDDAICEYESWAYGFICMQ